MLRLSLICVGLIALIGCREAECPTGTQLDDEGVCVDATMDGGTNDDGGNNDASVDAALDGAPDASDSDAAIDGGPTCVPTVETCNGKDDDCDMAIDEGVKTVYYRDRDGDNVGVSNEPIEACSAPDGYAFQKDDCFDADANAYPGQQDFFNEPVGGTPSNGYDYDCDGAETKKFPNVIAMDAPCNGDNQGYYAAPVPDCGGKASGRIYTQVIGSVAYTCLNLELTQACK